MHRDPPQLAWWDRSQGSGAQALEALGASSLQALPSLTTHLAALWQTVGLVSSGLETYGSKSDDLSPASLLPPCPAQRETSFNLMWLFAGTDSFLLLSDHTNFSVNSKN